MQTIYAKIALISGLIELARYRKFLPKCLPPNM